MRTGRRARRGNRAIVITFSRTRLVRCGYLSREYVGRTWNYEKYPRADFHLRRWKCTRAGRAARCSPDSLAKSYTLREKKRFNKYEMFIEGMGTDNGFISIQILSFK